MKKLLAVFIILVQVSCSKNSKQEINFSQDSDTIFWKKKVTERINKLISIKDIEKLEGNIFRFSIKNLVVETNYLSNNYSGKIILFAQKVNDKNSEKLEKDIFKKEYKLTINQIKQINSLLIKSKIERLPSDKFIKGWIKGLDGETYIFETKKGNQFTYKNYWSPHSQRTTIEAKKVDSFVKDLFYIIQIQKIEDKFRKSIPFKRYWTFD